MFILNEAKEEWKKEALERNFGAKSGRLNLSGRKSLNRKEFRMNSLNHQKFLSIFNDMLTDRNGTSAAEQLLHMSERGDEVDQVNFQKEQNLEMRLDQRNILFLKKVEEAKQKILNGTYGVCEECDSDISTNRLQARPTATLCINCQEEKERSEFGKIGKRRDLTDKKLTEEDDGYISQNAKISSIKDIAFESVVDL